MMAAIRTHARIASHTRAFSAAGWSFEKILQKADEVHSTPYVPKNEPDVVLPDYKGMTPDLAALLKEPRPASYTPAAKRQVRPTGVGESVLQYVGNTPLIRCSRLQKHMGVDCEILAKCEYYSAGGSVKDRIALRMIQEAEKDGLIKPGDTLIEPTSGNTGVGICMAGAVLGYKVIICLPKKMSGEKVNTMKRLGASIIRTPTEAAWNAPDSHITLAARLQKAIPNSYVLDQYKNRGNPLAHYENTAEEIIEQTGADFTHICLSAGTGGTLTGTAKKIKERLPHVQIIAVDPVGSILAKPDSMNDRKRLEAYQVEGIGYDFIPTVLDQDCVDHWVKIDDPEAFQYARALVRHEGMLIGGSCGSAMSGAAKFIKEHKLGKGHKMVVMLPDSSRNYMSKFMADEWMEENGFSTKEDLSI
jgi:cystathionine beta-synthase